MTAMKSRIEFGGDKTAPADYISGHNNDRAGDGAGASG